MSYLTICIVIIQLLCNLAAPQPPAPDDCSQYAEPRVFLDSQSWWTTFPGQSGTNFGHTHVSTCFPLGQHVSGVISLNVRVTMHDNPGSLDTLTIQMGASGNYVAAQQKFKPPLTCTNTCQWWVPLQVNVGGFPNSGYQEVRIRAHVREPDGKINSGSTGWQIYVDNGKPRKDYRQSTFIQGTGWYTDVEYTQSRLLSGLPPAIVSGVWLPRVECHTNKVPVTECLVTIDPDFHMNNDGIVFLRVNHSFRDYVPIDTRLLTNGLHKLVIRTDATAPTDSTASGVLGAPFMVMN